MHLLAQKQTTGAVHIYNTFGKREAIFPKHHMHKPTRRNHYLSLNCYRWQLRWLPDAT